MDTQDRKKRKPSPKERQTHPARRSPQTAGRQPHRRPAAAGRAREQTQATQEVVYLPPKPFNRNRLILRMATVAAVVVAIFLACSVFFKVGDGKILVSGTNKYSAWDICQASGIRAGDNLLSFGQVRAAGRIKAALPYVKYVRIGIKLPDTVNIEITEVEVTYSAEDQNGDWWLLGSDGRVIDKAEGSENKHTKLLGVQLVNPEIGKQAAAWENAQAPTDGEGNPLPVTQTAAQRLTTALNIAEYLERNGIIGSAASIRVEDMANIELWYGQRYQVKLGDNSQLSYKISCMKSVINQMDAHQSGILDVTFTIDPDGVRYTPFH